MAVLPGNVPPGTQNRGQRPLPRLDDVG